MTDTVSLLFAGVRFLSTLPGKPAKHLIFPDLQSVEPLDRKSPVISTTAKNPRTQTSEQQQVIVKFPVRQITGVHENHSWVLCMGGGVVHKKYLKKTCNCPPPSVAPLQLQDSAVARNNHVVQAHADLFPQASAARARPGHGTGRVESVPRARAVTHVAQPLMDPHLLTALLLSFQCWYNVLGFFSIPMR